VLRQQRQHLAQAGGIITDPDRSHYDAGLVDHGHVVMILGPVDAARYRYHRYFPFYR
jgi:hypothetical protein